MRVILILLFLDYLRFGISFRIITRKATKYDNFIKSFAAQFHSYLIREDLTLLDLENNSVNLRSTIESANDGKTCVILGTYAADFNAIEYAQRLVHYIPTMREKGIKNYFFILNCGILLSS